MQSDSWVIDSLNKFPWLRTDRQDVIASLHRDQGEFRNMEAEEATMDFAWGIKRLAGYAGIRQGTIMPLTKVQPGSKNLPKP